MVHVHASGAITLTLGVKSDEWRIGEGSPSACFSTADAAVPYQGVIKVSAGVATNGTDSKLGSYEQFTQTVTAPPALKGAALSTRYYIDVSSNLDSAASFEFTIQLPVSSPQLLPACNDLPIISFPFSRSKVEQPTAWLAWRGEMIAHVYSTTVATDTAPGTSPLVLIGSKGESIVVSPSDEFLTTGVGLASWKT